MVENLLTDALLAFLKDALKEFVLESEESGERTLRFFEGYLPARESKGDDADDDLFPYVLVRPDSGETDQNSTMVSISIIVGAYSERSDGYKYAMNVMTRIRTALCSLPGLVLDGRYQLRFPFKWENYPEQPYPQWQIDMKTNWLFRTPLPVPPNHGEIFYE